MSEGVNSINSDLIESASQVFFSDVQIRPTSGEVVHLIELGLSEGDVAQAAESQGFRSPKMDIALQDLSTALPYYHKLSDKLAEDHSSAVVLFAGRDAEALYDDFSVVYGDEIRTGLLPASSELFYSETMSERKLVKAFFEQYFLSKQDVENNDNQYVLVDSGFNGTIGLHLNKMIDKIHRVNLRRKGALTTKLVCTYGEAPEIISFNYEDDPEVLLQRPIMVSPGYNGLNFDLAVTMQMTPRYHGPYSYLRAADDSVFAMPKSASDEGIVGDIDNVEYANQSIVNPFAAAIFQYRTVKAALDRAA